MGPPVPLQERDDLIELLEITPEEQRHMSTIIGDEEYRRRDREYRREKRRPRASTPRPVRKKRTADRQKKIATARTLKECGLSTKEIAQAMKLSERQVQRLLQAKA